MRWLAGLILFLFLFGCAAPQVKPEEGLICIPGEIYFDIDSTAWKYTQEKLYKTHPILVRMCIGNDEGDALNLEVFYDGWRYQLYGKTYEHLKGFKNLGEAKAYIEQQRSKIKEQIKE